MRIQSPLSAGLTPGATPYPSFAFAGSTPSAPAQRLTLSPDAIAAALGKEATPPQLNLVRSLLYALSGCDPETFTIFYLRAQAQPAQAMDLSPHGEMLQRVLMGTVRDGARQVLACSVSLRFSAQLLASDWGSNLSTSGAEPAAAPFTVEYESPMAQLIGQQLRFECMADARGLWPLQAQLLSGVVRFGSNVAGPQARKPQRDAQQAAEDPAPDEAPRAAATAEDDSGPPRISASRWMELKMFGWIGRLAGRVGELFG